jgi:drug/metabolite transporter (DMT)-like permease
MNIMRAHFACMLVVCIWSGWITISRYGVHSSLTPADITFVRYLTAFILISPLILRYNWNNHKASHYLMVGLGIGFPYTLVSFYGLEQIKASHAGVLVNGMLPVLGAIAAWFLLRQRVSNSKYLAIALLFLSNLVMAGGETFSLEQTVGILLLLSAATLYTMHMIAIKRYHFEWSEVLITVPVVNTLLFFPCYFFLPANLVHASFTDIVTQAFYQGVMVNIIALMLVAYAIKALGTITVSIYMSVVPITTALLAWLFLGEGLNSFELGGITGCSIGLFIYAGSQMKETAMTLD